MTAPRLLALGGMDPSGGAGLTLDVRVAAAHGVHALPVAVALTAQNRRGFRAVFAVPEAQWRAACDAALDDGPVHAVKVGLLASVAAVEGVAAALAPIARQVPIVVDPVLSATAGGLACAANVAAAYRECLVPLARIVLPNRPELAALFDGDPHAALALGAEAVLCKDGHGDGPWAIDELWSAAGVQRFARARLACGPVRGTGCALGTAIAAGIARGAALATACADGGDWLHAELAALGPSASDGLPRVIACVSRTSPR